MHGNSFSEIILSKAIIKHKTFVFEKRKSHQPYQINYKLNIIKKYLQVFKLLLMYRSHV